MNGLRVLFCAPEVSPYAKTGGLADVVGSLPAALQKLGCDVRILMPLYRTIREKASNMAPLAQNIPISVGIHDYKLHFQEGSTESGNPIYFLEKDEFFDRSFLYGSPERGDYEDNAERFVAFSRAVHLLCVQLKWLPAIFHLHDWQTGLVSAYHRLEWQSDPRFARTRTVFTIHNLAYQGLFPASYFGLTHLPPEAFSIDGMEFWGQCSFLKAGLIYSDFLTTVSPRYSQEIQQPRLGSGLEGVLQKRQESLRGILNGVDYAIWDPKNDPLIPARYDATDVSGKRTCKEALLSELDFPKKWRSKPLLAMIGRLAAQKGFDLLIEIIGDLMALPVALVVLGTGDSEIESRLQVMTDAHPNQLRLIPRFDEGLAHRIEAGADIFLMPSHYEPCGLNQLYSLRYGTIPVVHATGGLEDSIVDVLEYPHIGTGFKFYRYEAIAFLSAVRSAIEFFAEREKWLGLMQRAMIQDFSWDRATREYLGLYEELSEGD